jgi:hypothetical protein
MGQALCLGHRQRQADKFTGLPVNLSSKLTVKKTKTLEDKPPLGVTVLIVGRIAKAHG